MKKVCVIFLLIVLCLVIILGSCENTYSKNDNDEEYDDDAPNNLMCKIISDKREFALDDEIQITIGYGWIGYPTIDGVEDNQLMYESPIVMSCYLANMYPNTVRKKNISFVKDIDDFFSLKYKITPIDNGYEFSHAEEVVLPISLFEEDYGIVVWYSEGTNDYSNFSVYNKILYAKTENKIVIEEQLHKFNKDRVYILKQNND